jgi:hypothetical protein
MRTLGKLLLGLAIAGALTVGWLAECSGPPPADAVSR